MIDYLLTRINGVIVPGGGGFGAALDQYWSTLNYIVNAALAMNAKGDKFFVWGTCAGFQLVAAAIANDLNIITGGFEGLEPLMMPLNFTSAQPGSTMFGAGSTPQAVLRALTQQPSTLNWHSAGITPAAWAANAAVTSTLTALSTNTEPSGKKSFVSSYEGQTANIFATQFHPERPPFEYSNPGIGHSNADILVSRYLAEFIRGRLELNTHTFDVAANGEALAIENYYSTYEGYGTSTYFISKFPAVPSLSAVQLKRTRRDGAGGKQQRLVQRRDEAKLNRLQANRN
jgi:gamma-glutamyl hydrolase